MVDRLLLGILFLVDKWHGRVIDYGIFLVEG
jgi:hypothetical protein